ncbi:MAG: NAD-dependent epimerase/dehydratase family protein [Dehalococcoidia bacterium]|nr:NAD-dependent epimerase/dehydratase family protein [Dehalococcoidia bacterium]
MTTETGRRRVFLTGATGSMGFAAARAMIELGHEVHGVSRSPVGAEALRALGATPLTVDLFDADAVREAMRGTDAVAHFATKIPEGFAMLKPGAWRMNDRLRDEGTRHLIAAAEANGIRRFVFESLALAYPDSGDEWIDESVQLHAHTGFMRTVLQAEDMLDAFGRRGGEPVSLRFPRIYGPGRASDGFMAMVQKRQMPIVGPGANFTSAIHTDDVGTAVAAALTVAPGVYNISDDGPMRQREAMQHIARTLGAPAPRRMAYPVARMVMGRLANAAVASQRVSNRRFREATGWQPRFPSAIEGWPDVVRRQEQGVVAAR